MKVTRSHITKKYQEVMYHKNYIQHKVLKKFLPSKFSKSYALQKALKSWISRIFSNCCISHKEFIRIYVLPRDFKKLFIAKRSEKHISQKVIKKFYIPQS